MIGNKILRILSSERNSCYSYGKKIEVETYNEKSTEKIKNWLKKNSKDKRYRIIILKNGHIIANWVKGIDKNKKVWLASVAKSIYSCILGIAIAEGRIPSLNAKVIDYFPEAFEIPPGKGPKPGRYSFAKDRNITFRHLISNTSGYMKPNEEPGKVFHYQTYGMNILTHAIAKAYGVYAIKQPEKSGFKDLIDEKIKKPIGANWEYELMNFNEPQDSYYHIYGYYTGIKATAYDMARLGLLWCRGGRWIDKQVVPEHWLKEATKTAPDILKHCPQEQWKYGYGFWTNDYGQISPELPLDSFAASGAGGHYIWISPGLDMVVVLCPGPWDNNSVYRLHFIKKIVEVFK